MQPRGAKLTEHCVILLWPARIPFGQRPFRAAAPPVGTGRALREARPMGEPPQHLEIDSLLAQLQTSGKTDSSGVFTVSLERARDKLSKFALPNPRHYVLNLLASAVAGGARSVAVEVDSWRVSFAYDGEPLAYDQLQGLWNALLHPADTTLHELAVALNAARSLAPLELAVESWDGQGGCRLEVEGDNLRLARLAQPPGDGEAPVNRVWVRERVWRSAARWAFGAAEHKVLCAHSHLGPARVVLNGRDLQSEVRVGRSPYAAAWLHLCSGDSSFLQVAIPDSTWAPACLVQGGNGLPLPSPGPFEAVLALDTPEVSSADGLRLVVNGVEYRRPGSALGWPFACGVVSATGLRKNVSHTDLAEDEAYRELMGALQGVVDLLIVQRMESPQPMPEPLLQPLLEGASALKDRLQSRGLSRDPVVRWVKEANFLRDLSSVPRWRSLTQELQAMGDARAAEAMESRLADALTRAATAAFSSAQLHLAATLQAQLVDLGTIRQAAWKEAETERLLALRALCGLSVEQYEPCGPGLRATLLRLLGRPEEALPFCAGPQTRAETLMALGRFEEAETLLRQILAQGECLLAVEALADVLSLAGDGGATDRRREGFRWRERASGLRIEQHPAFGVFLSEDLALAARATLPLHGWLPYRVRASAALVPESLRDICSDFERGRKVLRTQGLGAVSLKSALLAAELKFGLPHAFLDVARARAAHIMRAAGHWREADDVLARGHLIRGLAGHRGEPPDWMSR